MSTKNINIHISKKVSAKNRTGFTLIELIVVVTILAILGAIGFVTMTGYFAGARDSSRLSDMNNIYSQLNLTAGMDGNLPYPDGYRAIAMSDDTNVIAYQGYAAKDVLNTIKFEKGGRDPKDNTYFTYTTDKKRKQAQILGYFEEYDTTKLSNVTKLIPEAYAADLTDRKIGVIGKDIGILIESDTLLPAQASGTGVLDIANTSTGYVIYFNATTTGSGVGADLKPVYTSKSIIYTRGTTANFYNYPYGYGYGYGRNDGNLVDYWDNPINFSYGYGYGFGYGYSASAYNYFGYGPNFIDTIPTP